MPGADGNDTTPTQDYIQGHNASVVAVHAIRTASNSCAFFLPLLQPHHTILDVGCGPGSITSTLAAHIPQGHITGLDSNASVLAHARSTPNLPPNITFTQGDLAALPFADSSFDVVTTSQVLMHVPRAAAALAELRRVCKPGGFVACREGIVSAVVMHPAHAGLLRWQTVLSGALRAGGAHPDAGARLLDWAREAGFEPAGVTYSVEGMTYAGEDTRGFGENMAARMQEDEAFRGRAMGAGVARERDFEEMSAGFRALAAAEGGVWSVACGQIVARKGAAAAAAAAAAAEG